MVIISTRGMEHSIMRTTQYGIKSYSNLEAKLWDLLPGKIKNSAALSVFKNKSRKWIPEKFACKLCQTYIKNMVICNFFQIFARRAIVF